MKLIENNVFLFLMFLFGCELVVDGFLTWLFIPCCSWVPASAFWFLQKRWSLDWVQIDLGFQFDIV